MKQMQIYVSMPSFNMSNSKHWHGTRAQLHAFCVCVCVYVCGFWCQLVHAIVYLCMQGCVFNAVFALQGCCRSVIKRRSTKGEERGKKGVKLSYAKEGCLLVQDSALIRCTDCLTTMITGDKVQSARRDTQSVPDRKRKQYCCTTRKQEIPLRHRKIEHSKTAIKLCVMTTGML